MNYIQVEYVYEIQIIIIVLILDNNSPYLNLIDFTHYILSQLQFTSTIFRNILYRLYIYKMTNEHSHFMATQIQEMKKSKDAKMVTDSNAINNQDIEKKKKKKKKKKNSAYKNLLKSIKKSSRTEKEKNDDYKRKISQSLGGGDFGKINRI